MKRPTSWLKAGLGLGLLTLAALPIASAATSVPLLGDVSWGLNIPTVLIFIGVLALLAGINLFKGLVGNLPLGSGAFLQRGGLALAVVALLAASAMLPNGMLNGVFGETASAATPDPLFDSTGFEPTSTVAFSFANSYSKASASPAVKLYPSSQAVTEKAAFEGSSTPLYSGTATSGALTVTGIQVQTYGCTWDVYTDLTAYYQKIERNVNLCHAKNVLGTNTVSPPTIYMDPYGTLSNSLLGTSLTCSAGSQCTYSLTVQNSAADTTAKNVAVKFVPTGTTVSGATVYNATLDSVVSGSACEIVDISGTQYVKFQNNFGPLGVQSCSVKVTRAAGSADGQFKWTTDDNFMAYGATAWNVNSNVRGATATSATTVNFA